MAVESASAAWMAFGTIEIDTLGHRLFVDGEEVGLERKAFAVLVLLARDPGRVLSRDEILDEVWGHSHVTPSSLSRIIALLRHALGESGEENHYLHTVHGVGFRLDAEVQFASSREGLSTNKVLVAPEPVFVPVLTHDVVVPEAATAASPAIPLRPDKTRRFGKLLVAVIAGLLVVVAVLLGRHQLVHHSADAASVVDLKSIAVLPFENLSTDKGNAYFASGMQDMILTQLVGIGGLKVISRTSTEKYPSHPEDIKTIARQLGVATLLEGTVQKVGNQVLINVQLIDVSSGNHLWAKAYTRTLDNVFNVEGEVAQNVAEALKVQLTSAETARIDTVPTRNAGAYDLYLRAGVHANRAYDDPTLSSSELPTAISMYQQALTMDPDFALASAALARAHMQMYFFAPDRTNARLAEAKTAADRALALQPNLGQGHYALGLYDYWGHRDYAGATTQLELARQTLPNSATVELLIAAIARRQGRWDEALTRFRAATVLDPHSEYAYNQLGVTYQSMRRYAEADQAYAAAFALSKNPVGERMAQVFNELVWKGDPAPMHTALAALKPGSDAYAANIMSMYFERELARDYAGAVKVAEADKAENWDDPDNVVLPRRLYLAWALQAAGDTAKAAEVYDDVATHAQAALAERPDDADLHLTLGFAYAGLGRKPEAVAEGERAVALMPVAEDALTGADMLAYQAQLYMRVGQPDQAIPLIDHVLSMPAGAILSSAILQLDPLWDPLRDDPRFKALLRKYPVGS
ncbi:MULTISPECIES: winged helix-turn-helix domain-containing protein [unclassified Dyella]|uniref:winged helix-turn-helix domain-containing protein n=1 Tax=unclassified Dyella TaxID=2634549 RepID=UPI000C84DBD4|nr:MULTISPECIES: winged helix-turn-helix domain-containing protein [unclassified Dyella]MDR3447936.1 winged helix-turn-helix domain-containing protein [Dyella sp.]PMQ03375.1 DNA-binding response regulator MtrA [Dyella sp. AD56]